MSHNPKYEEFQDGALNRKEAFYKSKIKNIDKSILKKVNIKFKDFLTYQDEYPQKFSYYTKRKYNKEFYNFIEDKIVSYIKKQNWEECKNEDGFISYKKTKEFFPLIQLLSDYSNKVKQSKDVTHSFEYNDITFGSYVHIMTPARKAFLSDQLPLVGDAVILGAGLSNQLCTIVKDPMITRLIVNDLNIIPLLVTAYILSKQSNLKLLAEKKLLIHYGKAQDLELPEKSVQKIYAGYLIKYLSDDDLEKLSGNINTFLIQKGRFYVDEVNKESMWWDNHSEISRYFEWDHFLLNYKNFDVVRQREQASYFKMNSMSHLTRFLILQKNNADESMAISLSLQNIWTPIQDEWLATSYGKLGALIFTGTCVLLPIILSVNF